MSEAHDGSPLVLPFRRNAIDRAADVSGAGISGDTDLAGAFIDNDFSKARGSLPEQRGLGQGALLRARRNRAAADDLSRVDTQRAVKNLMESENL